MPLVVRMSVPCARGDFDCDCAFVDGLILDDTGKMPPFHDGCTCTVEAVLGADGFLFRRTLTDGRFLGVMPLLYGKASLGIGRRDSTSFEDTWEFPSVLQAIAEARAWDPAETREPDGWHRHPGSGRRRTDGDPAKEHRRV